MHPVIKHILDRKNKKVPIDDGRKIALVLFGGVMAGVRGTGVTIALEELGLRDSFDCIYAFSAGFPNASYFLAGEARFSAKVYYKYLDGEKFINFKKIKKIANLDYLVHLFESGKNRLSFDRIYKQNTTLIAGVRNVENDDIEYIRANSLPSDKYFDLLKASIAMPYLYPYSIKIGNYNYKDIGIDLKNDRLLKILKENNSKKYFTDILIVYNYYSQNKKNVRDTESIFQITPPKSWRMSRFETDTEILKAEAQRMGDMVKEIFGSKEQIKL